MGNSAGGSRQTEQGGCSAGPERLKTGAVALVREDIEEGPPTPS